MLPRRHILDIREFTEDQEELRFMAAGTLAVDAIKYINKDPKRDHLVEALELNEFICYMYPSLRPNNKALLLHVISDLLGLLLYGIPKKRRASVESLEIIDYSDRNLSSPVIEVWKFLKSRLCRNKCGAQGVIDGFINKIRVEVDIIDRYPFVEEILVSSREVVEEWMPSLSRFYGQGRKEIRDIYDKWSSIWLCNGEKERTVEGMVERLSAQVKRDFGVEIDKTGLIASILEDTPANKTENERFSRWYREGVDKLFNI